MHGRVLQLSQHRAHVPLALKPELGPIVPRVPSVRQFVGRHSLSHRQEARLGETHGAFRLFGSGGESGKQRHVVALVTRSEASLAGEVYDQVHHDFTRRQIS